MPTMIKVRETTCNDINTLRLIGSHHLKGEQELAVREHNRQTGGVRLTAVSHVAGTKPMSVEDWPLAVLKSAEDWKESCRTLEVENAKMDQIGRVIFASLATE